MRRLIVVWGLGAIVVTCGRPASARYLSDATQGTTQPARPNDFDFLLGEWRVHHRFLRVSSRGREWADASGTCTHRNAMGGWANIDEFEISAPSGSYRAVALRSFDARTGRWAIWWLDGRNPAGDLDPPMKGKFENGIGTFYGEVKIDGMPIRVRFIWSRITRASARWEQAYSRDDGRTWETNWIMDFTRAT